MRGLAGKKVEEDSREERVGMKLFKKEKKTRTGGSA